MAAEDVNRLALEKQELDDTVCCCICTDFYTDPKALPCIHTFCMKCLEQAALKASKRPGDEMPCPICRQQFKIPSEGFSGLPKNFFLAKLIKSANVPNPSDSSNTCNLCDTCLDYNQETGKEIPGAYMYCVDCKQKLCEECCSQHRKFKPSRNHKLIPLCELQGSDGNAMTNLAPSVCELHDQKVLDIYCEECKTVECAVCFIENHKQHKGSLVRNYVGDFRKQIESSIKTINECNSKALVKNTELVMIKEDMQKRVEKLEEDVVSRRDELKQFADSQANSLLQSLSSLSQSKLKEMQMEAGDIDAHLSCLQSYSSYCQKILGNGSDSDVCRAVADLSVRAVELQKQCQVLIDREIKFFKVSFTTSDFMEFLEDVNFIGDIEDDCNTKQKTTCTSKVALIKEQRDEIDLLKRDISLERKEKESFRVEAEQFKMSLNNEQATNKTLQVDNDKLRQELETQKQELTDLLKVKERENKDLEKTNTDLKAQILRVEQKREEDRKVSTEEKEKLINQLQEFRQSLDKLRNEFKLDATLDETIKTKATNEGKKSISGLTILDNELFVLSEMTSGVEVYYLLTSGQLFSRRWNLSELVKPQDIVSCARNKCLYIFDYKGYLSWSNEILRVDKDGELINKWSVGSNFAYSLSVTCESNVILPVYDSRILTEYSPDGQLIRKVTILSSSLFCEIWHAIKLANGHFVISLRSAELFPGMLGPGHGVCIVDGGGRPMKSFGGQVASNIGHMNVPFHMYVDGNGFVMVVDRENGRVLLLNSDLKFKKEILSKEEGLRRPTRISLNESNGRLFVADNDVNNQRILMFNVK